MRGSAEFDFGCGGLALCDSEEGTEVLLCGEVGRESEVLCGEAQVGYSVESVGAYTVVGGTQSYGVPSLAEEFEKVWQEVYVCVRARAGVGVVSEVYGGLRAYGVQDGGEVVAGRGDGFYMDSVGYVAVVAQEVAHCE